MHILKWLHSLGYTPTPEITAFAACGGHQDVIEWAMQLGTQLDPMVTGAAAYGGHLQLLEWLVTKHSAQINYWTVVYARAMRRTEVLQWLLAHGAEDYQGFVCGTAMLAPGWVSIKELSSV